MPVACSIGASNYSPLQTAVSKTERDCGDSRHVRPGQVGDFGVMEKDSVEARQFYTRSISPLVTKSFACKWSEDNRLAIVTKKGVHIFDLIPAPSQCNPILRLSRTFIHSSEVMPAERYIQDVVSEMYSWKKENVFSFLMNDALTPKFPNAETMVPEITEVFWSPSGLSYPGKCLITVINSGGAVDLLVQINQSWILIYEFTNSWAEVIQEDFNNLTANEKTDANTLKDCIHRLLATTATWSNLYFDSDDNCFAYFVTAYRNSEIALWKVHRILDDEIKGDESIRVELVFKKKLIDKSLKIHILHWVHLSEKNFLLFVGFFNGQIGVLKLQEFEGGITCNSYTTCYSDADNMPIDFLEVIRKNDKKLEIIVVKNMYMLFLDVDISGKMLSMKFLDLPGFSITGICMINPDKFLVVTQNGNLSLVETSCGAEDSLPSVSPVHMESHQNHFQYLGLAGSMNKQLFVLITSPNVMYDHLYERDPSCVRFMNLHKYTNFYSTQELGPVDILYKEQSVLKCWDCLELIKINAIKYNQLPRILSKITVDLESLSPYMLRLAYFILTINENYKAKNFPGETFKPPEELEQCKLFIFLYSASNYLNHLSKKESLSSLQTLCMSLLRNHLEIWLAGEDEEAETPLSETVKQALESTNRFNAIEQEKCSFCNEIITEPWGTVCPTGHKLPRCAVTCLQVTSTQFRSCIVCNEIYHPCLDLELSEIRCLYCDLPVYYRHRAVDPSLFESKRNFSKKQIIVVEKNETKEDDE